MFLINCSFCPIVCSFVSLPLSLWPFYSMLGCFSVSNVWILLRNELQCIECMEFPFQSTHLVCCYWYAHYRLGCDSVLLSQSLARQFSDLHENIITADWLYFCVFCFFSFFFLFQTSFPFWSADRLATSISVRQINKRYQQFTINW